MQNCYPNHEQKHSDITDDLSTLQRREGVQFTDHVPVSFNESLSYMTTVFWFSGAVFLYFAPCDIRQDTLCCCFYTDLMRTLGSRLKGKEVIFTIFILQMESITKIKGIILTFMVYIFVAVIFVALSQIMLKWVTGL